MPPQDRETLLELLSEHARSVASNFIDTLFPPTGPLRRELYRKHMEFFAAGKHERERAFMAANRVGKSSSGGGYELALHLTGEYPAWWEGRRFDRPIRAWAAGDTNETVREIIQSILLGPPEAPGSGLLRAHLVARQVYRRGSADAVESVRVVHASGRGESSLLLKSYEQGRKSFQGTKLDLIWLDEEPPMSIYAECLLRLAATTPSGEDWGSMMLTFTPLLGLSEVALHFMAGVELPPLEPLTKIDRRDLLGAAV
jgi:phage terminase large subunit-like protein